MKNYISAEGKQGRTIIARLKPGQDIVEGITNILAEKEIKAGYIPVLLGGFKNLKLVSMQTSDDENFPISIEREYTDPSEYTGNGTIAQVDGKPSIHIHLAASQAENRGITGHLVSGEVVLVTEIVIVELKGVAMTRKEDPEVFNAPLLSFDDEK